MVNAAIKKGVSQDLTKKWQDQLQEAEQKGNFAFTVISVLTSAFSKLKSKIIDVIFKYGFK